MSNEHVYFLIDLLYNVTLGMFKCALTEHFYVTHDMKFPFSITNFSVTRYVSKSSCDMHLNLTNGVFPKWSRTFTAFSEFRETDKSLKHELGSI